MRLGPAVESEASDFLLGDPAKVCRHYPAKGRNCKASIRRVVLPTETTYVDTGESLFMTANFSSPPFYLNLPWYFVPSPLLDGTDRPQSVLCQRRLPLRGAATRHLYSDDAADRAAAERPRWPRSLARFMATAAGRGFGAGGEVGRTDGRTRTVMMMDTARRYRHELYGKARGL